MILKLTGKRAHQKTDEELLAEFSSSGDLEILGELYPGYIHLVYGVCLKYLNDRDEAKDAVMQIFEKLIIEIPRQKIENFRSWLHVVTRNYCLMELRSKKSHEEKLKEWTIDSGNYMENANDMHPIDKDEPDMEEALADCIEKLKYEQKKCIRQFYYESRCYNEIAKNLCIDERKVKSHLQNGKRNLKICLEEKNERKR
ncbi:MAG: sigma-70 family RNA polymerase sigma factor [Bacteroidales bacterium]|nr:sigma-70 family RNA polymerase sigma factor [Bacteroidales bacterium]